MLWLTRFVSEKLGFPRRDVIAIEFCGSKKSLATGLPMASVIFGGASLGLLILPLMIYHQIQLMICSWLAARYGKQAPEQLAEPQAAVPHPDSYADFPDIEVTRLDPEEYEALWTEAAAKFPEI